ncbi:class E sortase [Corynebacterium epidermidicanis]|uniref:Sortase (Surface protein transpeptidase) n=1 Tax=Corynebacterium epidermidicanis TaxID=1050174 RepID=A0A0G3GSU8_9CORY|nr:class E sortase [Corynebacterium epidermidicanis]AKK04194.1 sortase (surface protein transpeptidase) [Corynebacterium epidermidicanis]
MTAQQPARRSRHRKPEKVHKVTATQILGELLITISVLLFSFAFYEAYWTNVEAGKKQHVVSQQMEANWGHEYVNPRKKLTPQLGEAFARMYIPAFGSDFAFAIVEGTTDDDLLKGPGRYVDSQMPGKNGNFAVAGHRVGKGAPFNDLGNLKACDAVIVETQSSWDIYRIMPIDAQGETRRAEAANCFNPTQVEAMTTGRYAEVQGRHITLPSDYAVVNPVPGYETTEITPDMQALMTMTTCHPQFSNAERMIVHAMKVRSETKTGSDRPIEFQEG